MCWGTEQFYRDTGKLSIKGEALGEEDIYLNFYLICFSFCD